MKGTNLKTETAEELNSANETEAPTSPEKLLLSFADIRKESVEFCLNTTNIELSNGSTSQLDNHEPPIKIKQRVIELPTKEHVGSAWLAIILCTALQKWNKSCLEAMESYKARVLQSVWTVLFLIGSLLFHYYYLTQCTLDTGSTYLITVFIAFLNALYLLLASIELYKQVLNKGIQECFGIFYCWIQCLYAGLTVFNFILFLAENNTFVWVYLLLIYLMTIAYSTNLLLWIVMIPFLAIFLIVEFVARALVCKLTCPHDENMKQVIEYGVYSYYDGLAIYSSQCVICLRQFTEDNKDLCISECGRKHVFHEFCIFEWIKRKNYCPICRGPLSFATSQLVKMKHIILISTKLFLLLVEQCA
eukprot:TRINITY_DN90547_c1_g1_i1.p1 TRINITY_DN90547_c1_g1~~TRINITY_DN90547_c1_g1_i1.p1  ORF type:complete len:402 (+),score=19.71 TRINITY_DN90547_c1_g1_i1:126-1208(+)